MMQPFEQALVGKDSPTPKAKYPDKDKKQEDSPTGRIQSGWLAEEKKAKQETDSEAASELECLSDFYSNAETGKGGQ